jgi:hypothetical protein
MSKLVVTPVFVDLDHPAITRAIVEHILENAHIVGQDELGREVMRFEFPVEPWMIDKLAVFGASEADLEPEPLDDDEREEDRARAVAQECVRPRLLTRRRSDRQSRRMLRA